MFWGKEKALIKQNFEEAFIADYEYTVGMQKLMRFLVIAEGHRFYKHRGYDIKSIFRAIYKNVFKHCHEGASTIDQQLVRVITCDYRKSYTRKLKEIILANWMDKRYSKAKISSLYLLIAYYGTDFPNLVSYIKRHGINLYEDVDDITAANIIARLKYPEPLSYNETIQKKIDKRVEYILQLDKAKSKYGK